MLKELRKRIRDRRADVVAEDATQLFEPTVVEPLPPPERDERAVALMAELAGRQPRLHAMLDALDPWQLRAVLADEPATLVRAQVGSGKTTVLAHKVLWLHLGCGVPLERMAVLTFTNRAAGEVAERIARLSPDGPPRPEQLWLTGTFHSVALALLRGALPVQTLGYERDFRVMDTDERDELWQRLISEHDLTIKHRRQLERRLALLEEGRLLFGNMRRPDDIERLSELIQEEKVRVGQMDFDDLLINCQALLAGAPLEPELDWVIVDELQDCSIDQLELVARLAGQGTRLFAVGDPNQVIYGWRGSSMDVFDAFSQRQGARVLSLPVNYRCSGTVVACARAFLAGSGPIAEAQRADLEGLVATREAGEPLAIVRHHDPVSEAAWLATRLTALHKAGAPWPSLGVLTRTRRQLVPVRTALEAAGVPVADPKRSGAREQPALAWLLRLLRGGLFPADGEGARRALTDERWGVLSGKTLSARRVRESAGGAVDLAAVAGRARAIKRTRKRDDQRLALEVLERLITLPAWLVAQRPAPDAQTVLEHLRVPALLRPTSAGYDDHLALCRTRLDEWLAEAALIGGTLNRDLAEVIGGVALGRRRPDREAAADGCALLTIHAAKGLEFDHVFISGVNEGLLPMAGTSSDPEGLAEERRLFFVALTRARHTVTLSWHSSPEQARILPLPGPFLRLLPAALVVWHDLPPGEGEVANEEAGGGDTVDQAPAPFAVGDAVRHRRYGAGIVERLEDGAVHCLFDSVGERRFLLAMCPLERRPVPGST